MRVHGDHTRNDWSLAARGGGRLATASRQQAAAGKRQSAGSTPQRAPAARNAVNDGIRSRSMCV